MQNPKPEFASANTGSVASCPDAWSSLKQFTSARIALGRAGGSWRTKTLLEFRLAHAQARDAVGKPFEPDSVEMELHRSSYETVRLSTAASSHALFLKRPDLGRSLSEDSRRFVMENTASWSGRHLSVIVSDGLSALAAEIHAAPVLIKLFPLLAADGWSICPVFVVPFARVKLQDEIGTLLQTRHTLMLIGERPGLGAPDSLGAYFTYQPGSEKTDADRNCVSNIRHQGLRTDEAGSKLAQLLIESSRQGRSGIGLKVPAAGHDSNLLA